MASLFSYARQVQRFLRDANQTLIDFQDIIDYVNQARREVAMRKHNHEKMNAERKLTDDQRREKIENKKVEEERKGLLGAVFK